jgi:glycyl-tRNA synthetase beta chain
MSDLLIEIGTEELPTQAVWTLSEAFAQNLLASFDKMQIAYQDHQVFATPRRLALRINQVAEQIPGKIIEHRGPPTNIASGAVQGFADKFNARLEDLEKISTEKGEYFVFKQTQAPKDVTSELLNIIEQSIKDLPIKKPMSWGTHTFKFVRPVHWALVLFGDKILAGEIFNQTIDRNTYGHRFLNNTAIKIDAPKHYENILATQGFVIADFNKRKQTIKQQIEALGAQYKLKPIIDEDLLNEVTSIVEWPVALIGQFSAEFLQLPPEVIGLTLKQNQKSFVLTNIAGELQPYFICIANIDSKDPKQVIAGNEKVVHARLSDAAFFFAQDKKQTLEERLDLLAKIIFQQGLGSMLDKSERIVKIAKQIATQLNLDADAIASAALLCKTDLTSAMVGEFPELQGIMGAYYAKHENKSDEIANAILEHYQPQGAGDKIPASINGAVLSISDKLDTLIGIFSLGKKPTGDKDPFGLRRAAIGILRILIEKKLFLDLKDFIHDPDLLAFIWDRLEAFLKEQSFVSELFTATRAIDCTNPYDIYLRVQALQDFINLPEASSVISAHKRVNNLLKQNLVSQDKINAALLLLTEEKDLVRMLNDKEQQITKLCQQRQYSQSLIHLAELKPVLDAFFDKVLVMDEDLSLKNNRLTLLKNLNDLFIQIADLSYLPAKS